MFPSSEEVRLGRSFFRRWFREVPLPQPRASWRSLRGARADPSRCEKRTGYVIGDVGCGEAKLAEAESDRHTVRSFDHVAGNDDVVAKPYPEKSDDRRAPTPPGPNEKVSTLPIALGTLRI